MGRAAACHPPLLDRSFCFFDEYMTYRNSDDGTLIWNSTPFLTTDGERLLFSLSRVLITLTHLVYCCFQTVVPWKWNNFSSNGLRWMYLYLFLDSIFILGKEIHFLFPETRSKTFHFCCSQSQHIKNAIVTFVAVAAAARFQSRRRRHNKIRQQQLPFLL